MANAEDIDGKLAQGWGGQAPNGNHVNVLLARRGSPTAAALATAFTAPSPGFTPILACLGPDQPSYETVYPPTLMLNKVAPKNERQETLISGAAQVGIAQGILDAVAENILAADQDTIVFVSLWLDPAAENESAVREGAREATITAVREAVHGREPAQVRHLVDTRDQVTHPFYTG
jgi:formaldehyde-activating enzyme